MAARQPMRTCSISLPNTGMPLSLALSRIMGRELTTVLSVRLFKQSTWVRRLSVARGMSAAPDTPLSMISKSYSGAASLYSSRVDWEFTSLVL